MTLSTLHKEVLSAHVSFLMQPDTLVIGLKKNSERDVKLEKYILFWKNNNKWTCFKLQRINEIIWYEKLCWYFFVPVSFLKFQRMRWCTNALYSHNFLHILFMGKIWYRFKEWDCLSELQYSEAPVGRKQFLVTFKWIAVRHDYAANQILPIARPEHHFPD